MLLTVNSRRVEFNKKTIMLEKSETPFLCLLAATGNTGTPIELIKQLDIEIDLLKRSSFNNWSSQSHDDDVQSLSRLNRISVAQSRLNKKLKKLNLKLHVETGKGIWSLISIKDNERVYLKLEGTSWNDFYQNNKDSHSVSNKPHEALDHLTKTQKIIWNLLIERKASFVTAQALAIELNAPHKTSKQISDMMYKFKKSLQGSSYYILRSYHGEYCLVHQYDRVKRQLKTQMTL